MKVEVKLVWLLLCVCIAVTVVCLCVTCVVTLGGGLITVGGMLLTCRTVKWWAVTGCELRLCSLLVLVTLTVTVFAVLCLTLKVKRLLVETWVLCLFMRTW